MWRERREFDDDPLMLVVRMVRGTNIPAAKLVNRFLSSVVPTENDIMNIVRDKIRNETTSRCVV